MTIRIANHWDFSWYELVVTPDHITIEVAYPTSIPRIARTLAQAIVRDREGQPALPAMKLEMSDGRTPFGPPKGGALSNPPCEAS